MVTSALHKHSILLIADDDPMNLSLLTRILEKEGFSTALATNGEEAVARVRELKQSNDEKAVVVLMDINMPVMSGVEATQILKSEYPNVPVIALTALGVGDFDYAGAGFDSFFRKPVNFAQLISTIDAMQFAL